MTDETPKPIDDAPKPIEEAHEPHPALVPPGEAAMDAIDPSWDRAAPPATPPVEQPAVSSGRTTALLGVVAILLLVLVIGGIVVWRQGAGSADQLAQLQNQVQALSARADALEARPVPQPAPDLRPIQQRLAALDPIQQRLTALEQKPPPQAQLDAAGQQQMAALASRIDGITARQNQLGTQEQGDVAKINDQLTSLDARLTEAAKASGEIGAINERQARTAQLQAASAALAAGRPLGAIAGAPTALGQFATKPPPTEASLRLSFDAAAADARRAGQPAAANVPFMTRMWDRLQSGVVVREGDRVLVGDAVSGVLEHAKRQLEAGDLPGAVAALDGLAGPAAAAMAPWRAQAQSLIDARAALISAAHS